MANATHAHRPKLDFSALLRGTQIMSPEGIACAGCGEKVVLAKLSLHKLLRDGGMLIIALVLALQQFGTVGGIGSAMIGLLVMVAAVGAFYWAYTFCLYTFGRFVPAAGEKK